MLCCDWLWLISTPKILAIVLEFLLGKGKEFKSSANCVHTSFTRESVIISSIQVLFAEKCPGMNTGSIFAVEINRNQSQQSTSSVYLFQNRSEYWTFPVEAVALWVNWKPNKEFDLQMTGSQEVLFWYERTIISPRVHTRLNFEVLSAD